MAKKMVITLGSIATIIAVPAIAISCGNNPSKTNELSVTKHSHGKGGHTKGDKLLSVAEYQTQINDIKGKDAVWGQQILKLMTYFNVTMPLTDPITGKSYTKEEKKELIRKFAKSKNINLGLTNKFIYDCSNGGAPNRISLISEWQAYVKKTIQALENKIKIVKKHEKFEKWVKTRT